MRMSVLRLFVILLISGLVAGGVRAIPEVDVRIVDIRPYDDSNTELLIVLQAYRDVSSVERIIVRFVDPDTTLTRSTVPFTNLPFDADGQVRLRVPISNLPTRAYLLTIEAQNADGDLIFETSTDLDLSVFVTPGAPTPTPQPTVDPNANTAVNPSTNWLGIAGAGGGVLVIAAAGFWIARQRQRKPVAPPATPQNAVDPETIFISYSRRDWDDYVEPLSRHLDAASIPYWLDQHLLQGGDDWMDRIDAALHACKCCILCVSPDALSSRYVKLEYRYFFNQSKTIYPLMCRPADLPAELQGIQYYQYQDLDELIALLKGEDVAAAVIRHSPGDQQPDQPA